MSIVRFYWTCSKFCGGVLFCVKKEDGSDEHLNLCRSAAALRGGAQREIRSVEMTHDNMHITKLSGPSVKLVVNGVEDTL